MRFSNPSDQFGNNLQFSKSLFFWIHPCLGESGYQRLTGVGHAWLQTDSRDSWLRFFLLLPFLLKEDLPGKNWVQISKHLKTTPKSTNPMYPIYSTFFSDLFFFFLRPHFVSMPLNTGLDPTAWAMGHSGTVVERCWMVETQKKLNADC